MLTSNDDRHRFIDCHIAGVQAWSEDQDVWPSNGWSAFRRRALEAKQ